MKRLLSVVVAGFLSLMMTGVAGAIQITTTFDGIFTEGEMRGDYFLGQYTYESETPANLGAYTWGGIPPGRTIYADAILSFTVTVGDNIFTNPGLSQNGIIIDRDVNGVIGNYYVIMSSGVGPISTWQQLYLDFHHGSLRIMKYAYLTSSGRIQNISTSSVPEPSTLLLLGSGLLGLVGLNRRRKRTA